MTVVAPTPPPSQRVTVSVTVLIPCHNAAPFIRQAVDSCLGQTCRPEKILVVDDASTDGSSPILDDYAHQGLIELVRNSDRRGRSNSLNSVCDRIETRYTALLDADDIALPTRLERQVAFMDAHPELGCSGSFVQYINAAGKVLANGVLDLLTEADLRRYLGSADPFGLFCSAVILRTEVLGNPALRFRAQFWPADDIDLWNRIAEAGWQVRAQPEFLVQYRIHSASVVTSNARRTRLEFEWVRACLRARRAGRLEPTREAFDATLARMSWLVKLNRWRKLEAKIASRAAGFAYAEGRILRAVVSLIMAFCLQPTYVVGRVRQHML